MPVVEAEPNAKPYIKGLTHQELVAWLEVLREPPYRAAQIRRWLYQRGASEFEQMTNLPSALRQMLARSFAIRVGRVIRQTRSNDGTVKQLFAFDDEAYVESVLIPETIRLTLCVSTQAGCGLGCTFCATAKMGFKRNLDSAEILEQVIIARGTAPEGRRVSNLVFMGMGEPLANYEQTVRALETLSDADNGLGISPRRITVSTVGLVPQVRRLVSETRVNLAISLHAGTDDLRSSLMPINRKYPIAALMDCCRSLPIPRRKRITFEYLLLRGVNDAFTDARALARLVGPIRCKVNLIPLNPHRGSVYERPETEVVKRFEEVLRSEGIHVSVRRPRGEDIQAACGQLHAEWLGMEAVGAIPRKRRRDEPNTLAPNLRRVEGASEVCGSGS